MNEPINLDAFVEFAVPVLKGMANQHRLDIVNLLLKKPATVNNLANSLSLPQPVISQHLRILKESDLVRCTITGHYRLYEVGLREIEPLLGVISLLKAEH